MFTCKRVGLSILHTSWGGFKLAFRLRSIQSVQSDDINWQVKYSDY